MATKTYAGQVVTGQFAGPVLASALRSGPDGMAAFVFPLPQTQSGLPARSGFSVARQVHPGGSREAWCGDDATRLKFEVVVALARFWPQLANAVAYHLVDDALAVHKAAGQIDTALATGDLQVIARFLRLAALHSVATNCPDAPVDSRPAHC